jgi:hypothetical protein
VPSAHSYAEITTYWIAWYLGPILALLGLGGFALAAARAVIRRYNFVFVPALLVIAMTCLVYLIRPSITPDQIWASRRLLPVILPGAAVFAVMALDWIGTEFFDYWHLGKYFEVMTGAAIIVGALFVSSPLVLLRDTAQLSSITSTCKTLPANAVVLFTGMAGEKLLQPVHAFCHVPVMAYRDQTGAVATPAALAQVAAAAQADGKVPVLVTFGRDKQQVGNATQQAGLGKIADINYRRLEQTYLSPPQHVLGESDTILIGQIQPNGTVQPLLAAHL